MTRRAFSTLFASIAAAGVLAAEDKPKQDRLSGWVRAVDTNKHEIEVELTRDRSRRKIMYDDATRFLSDRKSADASAVKEGLRVVAVGKFEGVNLHANAVSLYLK